MKGSASRPHRKPEIPAIFFDLIRELYPVGIGLLDRFNLSMAGFLTLSYLKASEHRIAFHGGRPTIGRQNAPSQPARLVADVNDTLAKALDHKESWVTTTVTDLAEKGLVARHDISEDLRSQLFGTAFPGKQSKVVVLTEDGEKKLVAFNEKLNHMFGRLVTRTRLRTFVVGYLNERLAKSGPALIAAVRAEFAAIDENEP